MSNLLKWNCYCFQDPPSLCIVTPKCQKYNALNRIHDLWFNRLYLSEEFKSPTHQLNHSVIALTLWLTLSSHHVSTCSRAVQWATSERAWLIWKRVITNTLQCPCALQCDQEKILYLNINMKYKHEAAILRRCRRYKPSRDVLTHQRLCILRYMGGRPLFFAKATHLIHNLNETCLSSKVSIKCYVSR